MLSSSRRRSLILAALATSVVSLSRPVFASESKRRSATLKARLAQLEKDAGGRLGVSALDTATGIRVQYRADERFPVCSTAKTLVAAAILKKSESKAHLLQKRITYSPAEVRQSGYAPITEKHIAEGMTIAQLCAATLQYSDNAAANFLMKELGGPAAVTAYARSIGDASFRLDRWEPELNTALPGDLRDTSTPAAMEASLQRLLLGNALATAQRKQLVEWLKGNTTGDKRMAAGVPAGWMVGDKTGTGAYGTTNDVGILWPPTGLPIVAAIFFTQDEKEAQPQDAVLAVATRLIVTEFA